MNALANLACLSEYFHLVCVLELWPQFGCSKVVGTTTSSSVSSTTSTRALLRNTVTELVHTIAATASAFRIVILVICISFFGFSLKSEKIGIEWFAILFLFAASHLNNG